MIKWDLRAKFIWEFEANMRLWGMKVSGHLQDELGEENGIIPGIWDLALLNGFMAFARIPFWLNSPSRISSRDGWKGLLLEPFEGLHLQTFVDDDLGAMEQCSCEVSMSEILQVRRHGAKPALICL